MNARQRQEWDKLYEAAWPYAVAEYLRTIGKTKDEAVAIMANEAERAALTKGAFEEINALIPKWITLPSWKVTLTQEPAP